MENISMEVDEVKCLMASKRDADSGDMSCLLSVWR